jgi:hypothetical protein
MVDASCQTDKIVPSLFLNLREKLANTEYEEPLVAPLPSKIKNPEPRPSIQVSSELITSQQKPLAPKKQNNLRALLEKELLSEPIEDEDSLWVEEEPSKIAIENSFPMDPERPDSSDLKVRNSMTEKLKSKLFFRKVTKDKEMNEEGLNRTEGRVPEHVLDENISPRLIDSDASGDGFDLKPAKERMNRMSLKSLLLKSQDIDGSMSNMSEEWGERPPRERQKAIDECKEGCDGSPRYSRQEERVKS